MNYFEAGLSMYHNRNFFNNDASIGVFIHLKFI